MSERKSVVSEMHGDDPAWWRRPHGKSRLRVLAAALMLLPAVFFFSLTADQPHWFLLAALGLGISLAVSRPVTYNHRTVIYGLLIAAVLAVVFDLIFPLDDDRFMFLMGVLVGSLTVPMLILVAVLATFFASGPYQLGLCAALSLLIAMFCGDFHGAGLPQERFVMFASWLAPYRFKQWYAGLVVYQLAMLLLSLQLAYVPHRNRQAPGGAWLKHGLLMAALAGAVLAGYGMMTTFQRLEPQFRAIEMLVMRSGLYRLGRRSQVVFRKDIDLYRTLRLDGRGRHRIVVRAVGDSPPGYLRGRVYTHYHRGMWQTADVTFTHLPFRRGDGALAVNTFFRGEEEPPRGPVLFHFHTAVDASEVLLSPGHASRHELVADTLSISRHGMLQAEQWRKSGGYTVTVPEARFDGAFPAPPPEGKELLEVPKELLPELTDWLAETLSGKHVATDEAVVNAVVARLMADCRYSLRPARVDDSRDPVLHFMRTSRAGHCELFASAATLALRAAGIPVRYVTGFICAEPHPSGAYYVARMEDAHAWAEAWLRDEQRWVALDPTPSQNLAAEGRWGWLGAWLDRLRILMQRVLADIQRGYFAEAVITGVSGVFGFLRDLVWHPWRGGGIALLAVAAIGAWWRRHRRRLTAMQLPPETLRLHRAFARFERRVGRWCGIRRANGTPVGEWARVVAPRLARRDDFLALMDTYQSLRFHQVPPSREQVEEMRHVLRRFTAGKNAAS